MGCPKLPIEYYFRKIGLNDPPDNRTSLIRNLHQKPPFAWEKPPKGKDLETFAPSDLKTFDSKIEAKPDFWNLPGLTNFSYSYDGENRLLQVRAIRKDTVFIADYEYDNNGNLTSKTEYVESEGRNPPWRNKNGKIETTTYSYDFENRLTLITYPDTSTSEYVYDGVGKRIKAIEYVEAEPKSADWRNGVGKHIKVTKFLYDGLNVIIERDEDDNTVVSYVRGLSYGGGIGGIISVTRVESRPNKGRRWKPVLSTSYYHYDGIGAVTELTDKWGIVVQRYEYDSYGNLLSSQGNISNSYQFSTKEYSSKSGLIYFGARYYDPRIGRFITKDPAHMIDGPNMYVYLANNPVNLIDPFGLCKKRWLNYYKKLWEHREDVIGSLAASAKLIVDVAGIRGQFGRHDTYNPEMLDKIINKYPDIGTTKVDEASEDSWDIVHFASGLALGLVGIDRKGAENILRDWERIEPTIWSGWNPGHQGRDNFEGGQRGVDNDMKVGMGGYTVGSVLHSIYKSYRD